jgi:hypothetical protein
MLREEAQLDLVSRTHRRGAAVREYYSRYELVCASENLSAVVGRLDGEPVIGVLRDGVLSYFILLTWREDLISFIRDFRYVPYIAHEAAFTSM